MRVIIEVLIGFAAAVAFFIVEPMLLGLGETWRMVAAALVFAIVISLTLVLSKFYLDKPSEFRSIGVGNKSKKGLDIEIGNVKTKGGSGNIASQNVSGGNTTIKISDSEI